MCCVLLITLRQAHYTVHTKLLYLSSNFHIRFLIKLWWPLTRAYRRHFVALKKKTVHTFLLPMLITLRQAHYTVT